MVFRLPLLPELQALAQSIRVKYKQLRAKKKSKPSPQRSAFFNLYDQVVLDSYDPKVNQEEMQLVLSGALIYELEHIKERDYKGCSPEIKESWYHYFTGKGSALYTAIKSSLHISKKNKLTNDIRLRCLNKLYRYLQKNYPHEEKLILELHDHLANVKKRELDRIHGTIEGLPSLNPLEKSLAELPDDYNAKARIKGRDPERKLQLEFVQLITKSCQEKYNKYTNEFEHNFAYMQSCNVQYGLTLFIPMKIDHKHWVLSPKGGWFNNGSDLYKACLKILNVKDLDKIEHEKKIAWLRALSDHLTLLKTQGELPDKFTKYEKRIKDFISQEEVKKHTPKWYITMTQYLVRYGLSFAATKLTADIVLKWIGGTIASGIGGPIGLIVYLTGGTILVSQLGKLVTEKIIPKATAEAYAWALDRIGKSITDATMGNVFRFQVRKKGGLRELLNDPRISDEDRKAVQNWIETLLDLDDDIVWPAEKDSIRYIWEIDEKPEQTVAVEATQHLRPQAS